MCELGIDEDKFNILGGVIVLGYLFGMMGVCIIIMLLNNL